VLSGNNPVYGTSGFELKLADSAVDLPADTLGALFDNNGKALTEKIYLTHSMMQEKFGDDRVYINPLVIAIKCAGIC